MYCKSKHNHVSVTLLLCDCDVSAEAKERAVSIQTTLVSLLMSFIMNKGFHLCFNFSELFSTVRTFAERLSYFWFIFRIPCRPTVLFCCLIIHLANQPPILHEVELVPGGQLSAAHDAGEAVQVIHKVLRLPHNLRRRDPLLA